MGMKRGIFFAFLISIGFPALSEWKHEIKEDKMGRGNDEIATVISSNSLSLSPPYDGTQKASLSLRWLRDGANEFVVALEKGQIVCEQASCALLIRADDGKAFRITGAHPKDGSSDVVVGTLSTEELRKIQSAKKILIEVTVYQNGEQMLEFDSKDNPFIGRKTYLLSEVKDMVSAGSPPKATKYTEVPMDMPDFSICKKVANRAAEGDELRVVEVNKKDELTVATYFEDSAIKQTCKKGSKKSIISFFNYDR